MFSKINFSKLTKYIFIIICILIAFILIFSVYLVFFKEKKLNNSNETFILQDNIPTDKVFEITPENYSTILQKVSNDLDAYIGFKIHFTGYVYRLLDFEENEFVLARNMRIKPDSNQTIVIGFLCNYKESKNFEDGTWVDVTGIITKGDYYGEIAKIDVLNMFKIPEPDEKVVNGDGAF